MSLKEFRQAALAAKGAFLHERLAGKTKPPPIGQEESPGASRLALWQEKAGGNGGRKAFLKRLKLDNISGERARQITRDPSWNEAHPLPDWVAAVNEILKLFPADAARLRQGMLFTPEKENLSNNDLVQAVSPFVYYAEGLLQRKLVPRAGLFSPGAFSNMSAALFKDLSDLCFNTLRYRYKLAAAAKNPVHFLLDLELSGEEKLLMWQEFTESALKGHWREILLEFPVLARLMAGTISRWVENYAVLAVVLQKDAPILEDLFAGGNPLGQVAAIEAGCSDRHHHGQRVHILTFASGVKLVFKPRSLAVDQGWTDFIRWLQRNGMTAELKTPLVYDGGDHGWAEFMERLPLKDNREAGQFYFRAGVLLGLLYVLGSSDFHRENLIARGAYPVLVDTETLLSHRVRPFDPAASGRDAANKALDILNDSVLSPGFLPVWKLDDSGEPEDSSALLGGTEKDGNLPLLAGKQLTVLEYRENFLEGFSYIYDFLLSQKEALTGPDSPFHLFKQSDFRFLIRDSQIYGDLLAHTTKPDFLRDGLLYSLEIERLAPAYLLFSPEEVLPRVWPLYLSERDALHRRDVPLFYGRAEELAVRDRSGVVYTGYYLQSAVARAKELAGRLGPADKKAQLGLIENVLSIYGKTPHEPLAPPSSGAPGRPGPLPDFDYGLLAEEAETIYEQIMNTAISSGSGDITWIVQRYDARAQRLTLGRIGASFYDGTLGLGLFMSALYQLTQKQGVKDNALRTVAGLRKALADAENPLPVRRFGLGLADGVAGMARALLAMGHYLEDQSCRREARHMLLQVQPRQIEEDKVFDVIAGCAGFVLVLLEAYRRFGDEELLRMARQCGQRLLASRTAAKSGHRVWQAVLGEEPLTGFGHGAAGIACALSRLYQVTGDARYLEGALEALDYESSLYDPGYNNWPDLRSRPRRDKGGKYFMAGWCGGAPGIGLARIAGLAGLNNEGVQKDIENAIAFTLNHPLESSDHVCCGNSGRVDFLLEAARELDRPELLGEARRRMTGMTLRKRRKGRYTLNGGGGAVNNPSFFQGAAGIGYQILRCLAPERFYSVLS